MSQVEASNKNQITRPSEMIGKQIDFYVLRTTQSLSTGEASEESQKRINALIQLISLRATPCIVNIEPVFQETDPGDLDVTGTVDVHTMRFAIDNVNAWEGAVPTLPNMIAAMGHGFEAGNFSLTYQAAL